MALSQSKNCRVLLEMGVGSWLPLSVESPVARQRRVAGDSAGKFYLQLSRRAYEIIWARGILAKTPARKGGFIRSKSRAHGRSPSRQTAFFCCAKYYNYSQQCQQYKPDNLQSGLDLISLTRDGTFYCLALQSCLS